MKKLRAREPLGILIALKEFTRVINPSYISYEWTSTACARPC